MGIGQVSVDSHLFYDLGADSLVVTAFCARLRTRPDLPPISTKAVYQRPTIRSLAAALADAGPAPSRVAESAPAPAKAAPVGAAQYLLCGATQFLSVFGYAYLLALVSIQGYKWISAGSGFADLYWRAFLASAAGFLGLCALPILAKWTLIGRWKRQQFRV